jgi:ubiquitin-protein ligase E3 A
VLDISFPLVVYKKLLKVQPTLEDMKTFSPELYESLQKLLLYAGNVEEDIGQTFSVQYDVFGETKQYDLKPGGASIPVTNANRQGMFVCSRVDAQRAYLLLQSTCSCT